MRDTMAHPDVMPILSPGRHRSPRRGACFMEFASYLAGEFLHVREGGEVLDRISVAGRL